MVIPPIPGTRKPPHRYGWGLLVGVSKTDPGITSEAGYFEHYVVRTAHLPVRFLPGGLATVLTEIISQF